MLSETNKNNYILFFSLKSRFSEKTFLFMVGGSKREFMFMDVYPLLNLNLRRYDFCNFYRSISSVRLYIFSVICTILPCKISTKRIFVPERGENGQGRRLHNEKLHSL